MTEHQKLGQMFLKAGLVTQAQLDEASRNLQLEGRGSLLTSLVDMGLIPFATISKFVERSLNMKTMMIGDRMIDANLVEMVGWPTIKESWVFPLGLKETPQGKFMILGVVDPLDKQSLLALEGRLPHRIYPVLISKPDYSTAVERHEKLNQPPTASFSLPTSASEMDNLVIIRPGGYEQEIEMQAHKTTTMQFGSPHKEVDLPGHIPTSPSPKDPSFFLGESQKRFREEVLSKLDIDPQEIPMLRQESYTRELLVKELAEVSTKTLESAFNALPAELKIEALLNALIEKGIISRRDIFIQGATSFVFSSKTDLRGHDATHT